MFLNCLMGICYFVAPVMLEPATRYVLVPGIERMYVRSCEFSQALAVLECVHEPDVLMRSGFE
jgi:hypothetical protein